MLMQMRDGLRLSSSVSSYVESAPWRLADREFAVLDDHGRLFPPFRTVPPRVVVTPLPQYGFDANSASSIARVTLELSESSRQVQLGVRTIHGKMPGRVAAL